MLHLELNLREKVQIDKKISKAKDVYSLWNNDNWYSRRIFPATHTKHLLHWKTDNRIYIPPTLFSWNISRQK